MCQVNVKIEYNLINYVTNIARGECKSKPESPGWPRIEKDS